MTSLASKVTALCDEIASLKFGSNEHPAGLYSAAMAQSNGVKLVLDAAEGPAAHESTCYSATSYFYRLRKKIQHFGIWSGGISRGYI